MPQEPETYTYTVILMRQADGEWLADVPALPGCVTSGKSLEDAKEMAADAIACFISSLRADGEDIPADGDDHGVYLCRIKGRLMT